MTAFLFSRESFFCMDLRQRINDKPVLSGFVVLTFLVVIAVSMLSLASMNMGANPPDDVLSDREVCEGAGGEYLEEHTECVGVEESTCDTLNGEYTSCGSACRNNPDADMCIESCVKVCEL